MRAAAAIVRVGGRAWRRRLPGVLAVAAVLAAGAGPVGAADVANGSRIYNTHCLGCHGIHGRAVMPGVPMFASGERLLQPDFVLMQTIKTGKNIMPPFLGILRDAEILDVIAYLRTLRFQ